VPAPSGAPVDVTVDFPIAGDGCFPVADEDFFPVPDEDFYLAILGPTPAPAAAEPAAPALFPVVGPAPAGDINNLFAAPAPGRESSSPFLSGGEDPLFSPGNDVPSDSTTPSLFSPAGGDLFFSRGELKFPWDGTSPPVPELPSFPDVFPFGVAPTPAANIFPPAAAVFPPAANNTTFPPATSGLDFSFGVAPAPAANDNFFPPVTTGFDFSFGAAPLPAADYTFPAAAFAPAADNNLFPPVATGFDFPFGAAPLLAADNTTLPPAAAVFPPAAPAPAAPAAAGQKRKREEEEVVVEEEGFMPGSDSLERALEEIWRIPAELLLGALPELVKEEEETEEEETEWEDEEEDVEEGPAFDVEGHSTYTGGEVLGVSGTWEPEIWTPEEPAAKRRRTE
jgi:hypothetical protein